MPSISVNKLPAQERRPRRSDRSTLRPDWRRDLHRTDIRLEPAVPSLPMHSLNLTG